MRRSRYGTCIGSDRVWNQHGGRLHVGKTHFNAWCQLALALAPYSSNVGRGHTTLYVGTAHRRQLIKHGTEYDVIQCA